MDIFLDIIDDSTVEVDETIVIDLVARAAVLSPMHISVTVTILDDEGEKG